MESLYPGRSQKLHAVPSTRQGDDAGRSCEARSGNSLSSDGPGSGGAASAFSSRPEAPETFSLLPSSSSAPQGHIMEMATGRPCETEAASPKHAIGHPATDQRGRGKPLSDIRRGSAVTQTRSPMRPPTPTQATRRVPAPGPATGRAATTDLIPPRVEGRVEREQITTLMTPTTSRISPKPNAGSNPNTRLAQGGSAGGGLFRSARMSPTHYYEARHLGQPTGYLAHHHRTVPLQAAVPVPQARSSRSGPCQTPSLNASRWVAAGRLSSCNLIGIRSWNAAYEQMLPATMGFGLRRQGRALRLGVTQPQVSLTRRRRTTSSSI